MDKVDIDEELHEMFDEGPKNKIFDSATIRQPLEKLGLAQPIVVESGSPVSTAIEMMQKNHVGCILIVHEGKLAGIFTERDLLMKCVGRTAEVPDRRIDDVMTRDPETLLADDMIAYALHMMAAGGFMHIPVVDAQNRPVSVVSIRAIVEFLVEMFPDEVLNLPRSPGRKSVEREGA
jgi:CBS domain-containing protein